MTQRRIQLRRFLAEIASQQSTVRSAHHILAPVVAYDTQHNADLTPTLRTYFLANGNVSRAANLLFLHRNGLLYRLGRIEELLRVSLDNPTDRLALELALEIVEIDAGTESELTVEQNGGLEIAAGTKAR